MQDTLQVSSPIGWSPCMPPAAAPVRLEGDFRDKQSTCNETPGMVGSPPRALSSWLYILLLRHRRLRVLRESLETSRPTKGLYSLENTGDTWMQSDIMMVNTNTMHTTYRCFCANFGSCEYTGSIHYVMFAPEQPYGTL